MATRRTVALLAIVALSGACRSTCGAPNGQSLADARRGFHTHVVDKSPRSGPAPAPPPDVFALVHYPSAVGPLPAYVSPSPTPSRRLPAIMWIPGGFDPSLGPELWADAPAEDDQTARAFREAGIVLMIPALRGGNDNPAPRESCFGEVDDVIAAADFLSKLDYVDPERIYLGGHSTGGTLALLVAESTNRFRAVFSFGAVSEVRSYGASNVTFDVSNAKEARLRAPKYYVNAIRTPTYVIEGESQPNNIKSLAEIEVTNPAAPVHIFSVRWLNHYSILAPATTALAKKIATSDDVSIDASDILAAVR